MDKQIEEPAKSGDVNASCNNDLPKAGTDTDKYTAAVKVSLLLKKI